jgi:twitching motility protein PilT
MKNLEQLLRSLERDDVEELMMVTGRLPCVRVGTSYDPLDDAPLSSDSILAMLVAAGGSRYVDALGPVAKQWQVRAQGLGVIRVSAFQRGQHVEARFSLTPGAGAAPVRRPVEAPSSSRRGASLKPAPQRGRSARPEPAPISKRPSRPAKASQRPAPKRGQSEAPRSTRPKANEFRRAPTAPAVPRARRLTEPAPKSGAAEVETPRAHVRVRPISVASPPVSSPPSWRVEADTQPDAAAQLPSAELRALLEQSRAASATDLHIVAGRPALFRIGGELRPQGEPLFPEAVERIVRSVVPRRLLPVLEDLGSCDFALDQGELGRFRVNVGRQQTGLKACLRLIPRELPTLKSLGLPPDITRASGHHQGLVIFSGPTGHGKTTTMTAVVDHINHTTTHHIITVEDPVENLHPKKKALISQREVGTHTATFASALRAALREDPDVIVVGELRDAETVSMAVAASETGHLVLGTMNTPSAAKTIDRLIDLFPPADQPQVRLTLAAGLRLIVGQRLVPNIDRSGVHAAIELLPGSLALSALIRDNKTFQIPSLQQRGRGIGILRLDDSLADLVRTTRVAKEDALALAESPTELEATLKKPAAPAPQPAAR